MLKFPKPIKPTRWPRMARPLYSHRHARPGSDGGGTEVVAVLPIVPNAVQDLVLWLDDSSGCEAVWEAAAPGGASASPNLEQGAGYEADGSDHGIRIYPYRTEYGQQVFGPNYAEVHYQAPWDSYYWTVNWSWDAVPGAEGYRIVKYHSGAGWDWDHYLDINTTGFEDGNAGQYSEGVTLEPQSSFYACSPEEPVTVWRDRSGLGNDALTYASRPVYFVAVVNGYPVVRFDGADDGLLTNCSLNGPFTIFAVYAARNNASQSGRVINGSNNWLLGPREGVYDVYNNAQPGGPAVVLDAFVCHCVVQSSVQLRSYLNGALVGSVAEGAYPGQLGLGGAGAYSEVLDGDIAEIIAYSRTLDETERRRVETYLTLKYGPFIQPATI